MRAAAVAVLGLLVGASPAAGATIAGKATGAVQAVSLEDGAVAAVDVARKGRYELKVPKGPYLVVARTPRRTRTAHAVRAPARGVGVKLAANGPTVGIGNIPIQGGANGIGMIVNGLLPSCQARKSKLRDVSEQVEKALDREQRLSDEGRSDLRFKLNKTAVDVLVRGAVTIDADGKPRGDFEIVDAKTGKVIDHVVVSGDPGEAEDLYPFLRHVGAGLGRRACGKRSTTSPKPKAPTVRYAGTFDWKQRYDNTSNKTHVYADQHYAWDATVTNDGAITQSLIVLQPSTITETSHTPSTDAKCTITAANPFDLGWSVLKGSKPNRTSAYVNVPRRVGQQVTVTGNQQNCHRFDGADALSCMAEQCAGSTVCGVSFPPSAEHEAFTEAISPGRSDVKPEQTHHGAAETATGKCFGGTETITRTISAELTISR